MNGDDNSFTRKRAKSEGTDFESISKDYKSFSGEYSSSGSTHSKKKKLTNDNFPWPNIFSQSKITVGIQPYNLNNTELMVIFGQDEFLNTFGYDRNELISFPFNKLSGAATARNVLSRVTIAILMGKNALEYINLYRKDGTVLSCHISIQCITGNQKAVNERLNSNNSHSMLQKWAVITIRSASIVGNTKHSGLSILGIERVSKDLLSKIGTIDSRAKARREESSKLLQEMLKNK